MTMDIHVQASDFTDVDLIENYSSLIWTERYSAAGDFELVLPSNAKSRKLLSKAVYLRIPTSKRTMVCETDFEQSGEIKVTGRSLESILERRVIENAGGTPFTSFLNYVTRLITFNIGVSATEPERSVPGFYVVNEVPAGFIDPTSFDGVKYGANLYTAVKTMCDGRNLGFEIINTPGVSSMQFRFTYGQDLGAYGKVNFSESIGNITKVSLLKSKVPYKNMALVNLPPEGNVPGLGQLWRVQPPTGPTPSGLDRREVWTDASDLRKDESLTSINLQERAFAWGFNELVGHAPINEVDFELSPSNVYKIGQHYQLGDIVNVINPEGLAVKHRVTEYIQSFSAEGASEYPTLTAV